VRTYLSNALHALGHRIDPTACGCAMAARMEGWKQRRNAEMAELRSLGLPASPDAMDQWFRALIAEGEK